MIAAHCKARVLLAVLAFLRLATLVCGGAADAAVQPRAVVVVPFDASSLAPDDQWMGDGIAQLISLGLAQHPAFVQIERSRSVSGSEGWSEARVSRLAHDVRAEAALYGRIGRKDAEVVLEPRLLDLRSGQPQIVSLPSMTMTGADLVARAAALPAIYAHALNVSLTGAEAARIEKAARPTSSRQALELFTLGQMAFDRGRYEDAVDRLLRAVEADPNFVVAQYTLGAVHMVLKNRWKAAAQFRAATVLDSTMPEPYKAIGDLCLAAPRRLVDLAMSAYSKAIELRPFYADAHVGLGDARAANGDVDGAIAAYQRALTFDPFNPLTYRRLGKVYAGKAFCVDADTAYRRAIEIDPRSADASMRPPEEPCALVPP